jgi:hypothetical protein
MVAAIIGGFAGCVAAVAITALCIQIDTAAACVPASPMLVLLLSFGGAIASMALRGQR